jgi:hypothetical protein
MRGLNGSGIDGRTRTHSRLYALADFAVSCRSKHSPSASGGLMASGPAGETGQEQSFDTIAQIVDNLGEPSEQP